MYLTIVITLLFITVNSIENINGQDFNSKTFDLSSDNINFCAIGADFQRELVYSLVYEYKYAYFVKIARLYKHGLELMNAMETQIKGMRNKIFTGKNRQDHWLYFKANTIELHANFRKINQELDEMTNNVEDGTSKEIAILIDKGKYLQAADQLVDSGNDGLIYSILHLLYLIQDRNENLFLDKLFKFNQHLLDKSYHIRASTVYLCAFSVLVGDGKMFTHSIVRLAQYSQMTFKYENIASRDLQKYDLLKLRKRYSYIRTGSPTGIQILIWSANMKKCLINKRLDEILFMDPSEEMIYTKNHTDFNSYKYKWTFQYNTDDHTHRIIKDDKYYIHISPELINGQLKIVAGRIYDRDHDNWKMIPIGDNEFNIVNSETNEKIISGPDFTFSRQYLRRRIFAYRDDVSDNLRDIDVWIIRDC